MGSLIPQSDPRLGSIESYDTSEINVASDFMALYTTRQKYRRPEATLLNGSGEDIFGTVGRKPSADIPPESAEDLEYSLARLYERSMQGGHIPLVEVRDVLRQAAGLICSSSKPRLSVVHYLVALPFQIFTKETIKLGVSLWLGVIHENPSIEPRILAEVVEAWERSIQRRQGLFNPTFGYLDPLHTKIELLPTDKALMLKKQQKAQDTLSPHSRVLQFFESHFNAIRLGNLQDQQLFCRLISSTVVALCQTQGHPLAREVHFRIVLFGLRVLKHLSPQNISASWKLKDQILSAALSWFKHPARYSICHENQISKILLTRALLGGHSEAIGFRSRLKTRSSVTYYRFCEVSLISLLRIKDRASLCRPSRIWFKFLSRMRGLAFGFG
jgi:phosphatidylinositol 4-kinase